MLGKVVQLLAFATIECYQKKLSIYTLSITTLCNFVLSATA